MLIQKTVQLLMPHVDLTAEEVEERLEIPPDPELGDVAFPCFVLSKVWKKAPQVIASELKLKLNEGASGESKVQVSAVGPYLNFFFEREALTAELLQQVLADGFGRLNDGNGKRVILDMSSPNIAKPFGIGHLRSTMIGNALYHLYRAAGYEAVRVNHLGDWGTQFGKQITAFKHWGDLETIEKNPVRELHKLYVRFHEEAEKNPQLETEAREWFHRLEQGDEEARKLWQMFVDESLKEFKRMYKRLGVSFDHYMGESFYNDKMGAVVEELREKGLLEESEGAQVVRLDEYDLPPCIILKSDGSTIYATRDLATAIYRHDALHGDYLLYVVGAEQSLHFEQVFRVLQKMGKTWAEGDHCRHVPFGLMKFEGKKMSSRKGRVVFLEDVLEEAVNHARRIIDEKNPDLADADEVAEAVGIGAIIFNDLKNSRVHEVDFSMEEALNFQGETGPYVQYTYARTQSLMDKTGDVAVAPDVMINGNHLASDSAWELIKQLSRYPEVIRQAVRHDEPSVMARYVLDVAKKFNRFYHAERILVDEREERQAKMTLVAASGRILQDGMKMLGMKTPARI